MQCRRESPRERLSRFSRASLRITGNMDPDTALQETVSGACYSVLDDVGEAEVLLSSGATPSEFQGLREIPFGAGIFEYLGSPMEPLRVRRWRWTTTQGPALPERHPGRGGLRGAGGRRAGGGPAAGAAGTAPPGTAGPGAGRGRRAGVDAEHPGPGQHPRHLPVGLRAGRGDHPALRAGGRELHRQAFLPPRNWWPGSRRRGGGGSPTNWET